jgi:hypothetical protein
MAESSAWMRAELARRRSQKRKRYMLVRDFDDLCPRFLGDFCVDVNDPRASQIAKATTLETLRHDPKGDVDPRRGQNRSPSPKFIADERG